MSNFNKQPSVTDDNLTLSRPWRFIVHSEETTKNVEHHNRYQYRIRDYDVRYTVISYDQSSEFTSHSALISPTHLHQ